MSAHATPSGAANGGQSLPTIAVIGAGRLGLAFAGRFHREGKPVLVWDRSEPARQQAREVGLALASSMAEAAERADVLIVAVPARFFREVLVALGPSARPDHMLLHATKGVAPGFKLMHQLVREETCLQHIGALGGPILASEILMSRPQAIVVGSRFEHVESRTRELLQAKNGSSTWVLGSRDLAGVEIAMAMRNVVAVAEGLVEGLGLGEPARALMAAAGLVESARLGRAFGAKAQTFVGVAGVGDLVARRESGYSRNQAVGLALSQGKRLEEAIAAVGAAVPPEGIETAREAYLAAQGLGLRLPLVEAVATVADGRPAREALDSVLGAGLDLGRADSFI